MGDMELAGAVTHWWTFWGSRIRQASRRLGGRGGSAACPRQSWPRSCARSRACSPTPSSRPGPPSLRPHGRARFAPPANPVMPMAPNLALQIENTRRLCSCGRPAARKGFAVTMFEVARLMLCLLLLYLIPDIQAAGAMLGHACPAAAARFLPFMPSVTSAPSGFCGCPSV